MSGHTPWAEIKREVESPPGALTKAWTRAEASKPQGWRILGVGRPEILAPGFASAAEDRAWVAMAGDAEQHFAIGYGSYPEQALNQLSEKLAELRGDLNG